MHDGERQRRQKDLDDLQDRLQQKAASVIESWGYSGGAGSMTKRSTSNSIRSIRKSSAFTPHLNLLDAPCPPGIGLRSFARQRNYWQPCGVG
jgi:hypothetical protein